MRGGVWGKDENTCMDNGDVGVITRGQSPPQSRAMATALLPRLIEIAVDTSGCGIDGE